MSQYQPPPMQPSPNPYQYQHQPGGVAISAPRTSGMAIASLICGIASLVVCGLVGIAGLILGIASLRSVSASQGMRTGKGLAIAGIATSSVGMLLTCLFLGLLLPALAQARQMAHAVRHELNAQQFAYVIDDYHESTGSLPPADDWIDSLGKVAGEPRFVADVINVPGSPEAGRMLAMNVQLDSLSLDALEDPAFTVLFFECRPGSPMAGGSELMPDKPRFGVGYFIIFADGSAEHIPPEDLEYLRWSP